MSMLRSKQYLFIRRKCQTYTFNKHHYNWKDIFVFILLLISEKSLLIFIKNLNLAKNEPA